MPSQQSSMQYQYALTEIYNEAIHGRSENSAPDIDNHILCTYTFEPEEVMAKEYEEVLELMMEHQQHLHQCQHSVIKNYSALTADHNIISYSLYLLQNFLREYVATIKTGLITRIQRRWRNRLKERQRIIRERATPRALHIRETTGKWPQHLREMP